ncbi:MAG: hypothetical protein JXR64_05900 [Spirochaetales bacterium]|nr:hypothetical protein [Spirochaetales bacterium]
MDKTVLKPILENKHKVMKFDNDKMDSYVEGSGYFISKSWWENPDTNY